MALTFAKNRNGDYELVEFWQAEDGNRYMPSIRAKFPQSIWDKVDTQLYIESHRNHCYDQAMAHIVGAVPYPGRFGIGLGTAAVTDYAEAITEGDCFIVKYFPGATVQIEEYDVAFAPYPPGNWIIEYIDSSKNIIVGKEGSNVIPLTDDLIGIYDVDNGIYVMKFEKYIPNPA